jgi:dihydroxyacetone kinase
MNLSGGTDRFSSAAYIGEEADVQQNTPPDPGAMAVAIFLRGWLNGRG